MTTTAVLTDESILEGVDQLTSIGKRRLAVKLLKNFDSRTILEILRQITPTDAKEPDHQIHEPSTDEEKEAYAFAKALGMDTDESPGGQALTRIAAILHRYGVTYEDLMAEMAIEREKTIRTRFPNLENIHREVHPDGPPLS